MTHRTSNHSFVGLHVLQLYSSELTNIPFRVVQRVLCFGSCTDRCYAVIACQLRALSSVMPNNLRLFASDLQIYAWPDCYAPLPLALLHVLSMQQFLLYQCAYLRSRQGSCGFSADFCSGLAPTSFRHVSLVSQQSCIPDGRVTATPSRTSSSTSQRQTSSRTSMQPTETTSLSTPQPSPSRSTCYSSSVSKSSPDRVSRRVSTSMGQPRDWC